MAKILIIEDDHKISRALSVRLKSQGYEVAAAFDGAQGVLVAKQEDPDLILLDISMPAGGGFLAAGRLRRLAATAHLPIIFITASKDKGLREKSEQYNPIAFLEKPFEAQVLLGIIQKALSETLEAGSQIG